MRQPGTGKGVPGRGSQQMPQCNAVLGSRSPWVLASPSSHKKGLRLPHISPAGPARGISHFPSANPRGLHFLPLPAPPLHSHPRVRARGGGGEGIPESNLGSPHPHPHPHPSLPPNPSRPSLGCLRPPPSLLPPLSCRSCSQSNPRSSSKVSGEEGMRLGGLNPKSGAV